MKNSTTILVVVDVTHRNEIDIYTFQYTNKNELICELRRCFANSNKFCYHLFSFTKSNDLIPISVIFHWQICYVNDKFFPKTNEYIYHVGEFDYEYYLEN